MQATSTYRDDPRVVWGEDGTVTVPNPGDYQGDYQIEPSRHSDGWVIRNGDHYITTYGGQRLVWPSVDQAIGYLIGAPQVAA